MIENAFQHHDKYRKIDCKQYPLDGLKLHGQERALIESCTGSTKPARTAG